MYKIKAEIDVNNMITYSQLAGVNTLFKYKDEEYLLAPLRNGEYRLVETNDEYVEMLQHARDRDIAMSVSERYMPMSMDADVIALVMDEHRIHERYRYLFNYAGNLPTVIRFVEMYEEAKTSLKSKEYIDMMHKIAAKHNLGLEHFFFTGTHEDELNIHALFFDDQYFLKFYEEIFDEVKPKTDMEKYAIITYLKNYDKYYYNTLESDAFVNMLKEAQKYKYPVFYMYSILKTISEKDFVYTDMLRFSEEVLNSEKNFGVSILKCHEDMSFMRALIKAVEEKIFDPFEIIRIKNIGTF